MNQPYKFIRFNDQEAYKAALERGLKAMVPGFCAKLCWWCDGTTQRKNTIDPGQYEHCEICGKDGYGTAQGLLIENEPAPASVVNQVLMAAERVAV